MTVLILFSSIYVEEDPEDEADHPAFSTKNISVTIKEFKDCTDWDKDEDEEDQLSDN
jgi:hypothetical protein